MLSTLFKKDEQITPTENSKYILDIKFNGTTHHLETDNLKEAILSLKPIFLKTKILMKITQGNKTCERLIHLTQGRILFRNKMMLDIFLNRLILKENG